MEEQILDIPFRSEKKLRFAGFWIRLVASLIDVAILAGVNYMLASSLFDDYSLIGAPSAVHLLYVFVGIVYFSGMESSASQATLGKMALGIKVGNLHGEEISFSTALGRSVAKLLSALIFFAGFGMIGWEPRKQGLHDKLAGTYVFHV